MGVLPPPGGQHYGDLPSSCNPITLGHIDVIGRAAGVFDKVVVGVLVNPKKQPLLDLDERIATIREAIDESLPGVSEGLMSPRSTA